MASTIFEQTGGTYTQVGDYMLPIYYRRKKKIKRISAFGECDTNDI